MNKLVIAHRGVSERAHENTLAAFESAVDLGCDMIEFDVRRTRDGTLVVHHDRSIAGEPLSALSLDAARSAAERGGFDLATLEEALALLKGRIRIDVELKERGYEEEAARAILAHFEPPAFCVTSFHDQTVARLRRLFPEIRCGLLLGGAPMLSRVSGLFAERRRRRSDASFLAPREELLRPAFLRRAERAGDELLAWTVDDSARMRFLFEQPAVAGVITNRPGVALEIRSALPRRRS